MKTTRSTVTLGPLALAGELCLVASSPGLVLFVHGSGSNRNSPRNKRVAELLQRRGLSTLLFDLRTPEEAAQSDQAPDIKLLAERVLQAIDAPALADAGPIGLFGANTGAATALLAAVQRPRVRAVVARGGRVDLVDELLPDVRAATLLIVGGADNEVLQINRAAYARLRCVKRIELVPRATHLFMEAGALEAVAVGAGEWFATHLAAPR